MREGSDSSQPGAFSWNRAPASFNAFDRAKTGSARKTPQSDIVMLARIQHLASLNCASHRMVARSRTNRGHGPRARSWMFVGISLSPFYFLWVALAERSVQTFLAHWN